MSEHLDLSYSSIAEKTGKPLDAWWVKVIGAPVGICITAILLKISPRTSPNLVTTASLLVGIVAGFQFFRGEILWGALAYQFSLVLDVVDGMVARMRGKTSEFGAFYDGIVNHIVYILVIIGLGLGPAVDSVPLVLTLLSFRVINSFLNESLKRPSSETWSHFVPDQESWLAKKGLLPPGSFPDRHFVIFFICPVLGLYLSGAATVGVVIVGLLELALLVMKTRKLLRQFESSST